MGSAFQIWARQLWRNVATTLAHLDNGIDVGRAGGDGLEGAASTRVAMQGYTRPLVLIMRKHAPGRTCHVLMAPGRSCTGTSYSSKLADVPRRRRAGLLPRFIQSVRRGGGLSRRMRKVGWGGPAAMPE